MYVCVCMCPMVTPILSNILSTIRQPTSPFRTRAIELISMCPVQSISSYTARERATKPSPCWLVNTSHRIIGNEHRHRASFTLQRINKTQNCPTRAPLIPIAARHATYKRFTANRRRRRRSRPYSLYKSVPIACYSSTRKKK